jgi:RNA polymerase sigma-70 factor (ECF subfamily)
MAGITLFKIVTIQLHSHYSDNDLWQGIQSDDHLMFKELYGRYIVQLSNQAYKILREEEQTRDLVQDVFLNLYTKRKSLPAALNPGAYLMVSVKNRCFNKLRDKKLRLQHLDNIKTGLTNEEDLSLASSVELKLELKEHITRMPQNVKTVFFLRHQENKSHKEIADEIVISTKTVEKYLSNAITFLKERTDSVT